METDETEGLGHYTPKQQMIIGWLKHWQSQRPRSRFSLHTELDTIFRRAILRVSIDSVGNELGEICFEPEFISDLDAPARAADLLIEVRERVDLLERLASSGIISLHD